MGRQRATAEQRTTGDAHAKAGVAYAKAWAAHAKTDAACAKADAAYLMARAVFAKAGAAYASQLEALHRAECPNSKWNGHTIFGGTS